jgi:Kef-type K+ transport system membrane component KefB
VFSPIFFGLAGASFDIRAFFTWDWYFYVIFAMITIVAIVSKIVGCGVPAWLFLKNRTKGMKVGVGMVSRGEVGLIVAGVAISSGTISQSIYAAILGMIMVTTVIVPLWLRKMADKELPEFSEKEEEETATPPDYIPTYPL